MRSRHRRRERRRGAAGTELAAVCMLLITALFVMLLIWLAAGAARDDATGEREPADESGIASTVIGLASWGTGVSPEACVAARAALRQAAGEPEPAGRNRDERARRLARAAARAARRCPPGDAPSAAGEGPPRR